MATVKGIWFFNGTITQIPTEETVDFSVIRADGSVTNYIGMRLYNMYLSYKPNAYQVHNAHFYGNSSWVEECFRTVDFGTTEQTVSDDFYTWLTANAVQQGSEPETDTLYTVNGSSLTTVANAIRGKTGTTGELIFPDGYVSAIEDISSVSDLSNAKDIAFGGNESGGKYVIEDETITPLFNQVKRITETEDAMTFEGATASLLNVVPGGGLPNAEESSFGDNDADIETGIVTLGTYSYSGSSMSQKPFSKYSANEAISIIGLRIYPNLSWNNQKLYLYNENGELIRTISGVDHVAKTWTNAYFDEPVNIAKGESFWVSGSAVQHVPKATTSNTIFNEKVTFVGSIATNGSLPSKIWPDEIYGVVDFIIGTVSAELPGEYQIARTTMDDIANEVKRISGTTGKITTSQILTTLQSIQLQDKSITPTAEVQTITPNDGYYGLSSVTVGAITEENEAVIEIVNEKMEVAYGHSFGTVGNQSHPEGTG